MHRVFQDMLLVPLKVDIEWSYINPLEMELKLEVYVFFSNFPGFPKPPSF